MMLDVEEILHRRCGNMSKSGPKMCHLPDLDDLDDWIHNTKPALNVIERPDVCSVARCNIIVRHRRGLWTQPSRSNTLHLSSRVAQRQTQPGWCFFMHCFFQTGGQMGNSVYQMFGR